MKPLVVAIIGTALITTQQIPRQKFVPPPTAASDLVVRLDHVGTIPTHANPTSPAVAGSRLLLIDQGTAIYVWDGAHAEKLLGAEGAPQGITPFEYERLLNAAANADGSKVYVAFISASAPRGIPTRQSPREQSDGYYVIVEYAFDGARLTSLRSLLALGARSTGHIGGGLLVLPDGTLLFSPGDNGDSFEDGRDDSQDAGTHLAKILHIDPATPANTAVVAVGVRCAQRLILAESGGERFVTFVEPGGWVAEEINAIRLPDLLAPSGPANFGWGRHAGDKKAREGTFYISPKGDSIAAIPEGEPGFRDPIAQFGRDGISPIAVSGPVASAKSFQTISLLFGDLLTGSFYAITGSLGQARQTVYDVTIVDADGKPVNLKDLAAAKRPDPRFFNFPDGTAGVLLERTGEFYKLTQIK